MRACLRVIRGIAMILSCGLLPACNCGGSTPGGGVDAGECTGPVECEDLYGAPPCGAWECVAGACDVVCPGCTDDDHDGYGVEAAPGDCAGPDCDDGDDTVFSDFVRSCYGGPSGTEGVGTCVPGSETCIAGVVGPCTGEVGPTGEACNTENDDCDGATDEGLGDFTCGIGACVATSPACASGVVGTCVPGTPSTLSDDCTNLGVDDDCDGPLDEDCNTICVRVAPSPLGNDGTAIADGNTTPFATIQAAIDWSAADLARPKTVCVAAGAACGATATFAGPVLMSNGISVLGDYQSTTYGRCGNSTTAIATGDATGVVFPSGVDTITVLDGFRIDRAQMATTAGVTVDGATAVILSDLEISNTPAVTNSYAVNLINGAEAQILRSNLWAGAGTGESIAIRSVGSRPTIRENCASVDPATGRCDDFCGNTNRAIRGRFTQGTGISYGVYLEDSPGASVETSAICGVDADTGAGIRVAGDGTGVLVRGNLINAWGGLVDGVGIWMEDCGGAAPWIVDNQYIAAGGDATTTRTDGIRAVGDCHPVIDSNQLITGGGEGGTSGANGVHCAASAALVASRCAVINNVRIQGSDFGFPPTSVGIRCDDDGCERIAGNVIDGRGGVQAWGLWLGNSGTVVEDNDISGGCTTMDAVGVHAEDSFARLHNNRIHGGSCPGSISGPSRSIALEVLAAAGGNELDVHSNVLAGIGTPAACVSAGIWLDVVTAVPPTAGTGIYRNNIIRAGLCNRREGVVEAVAAADPRIFEHNDLDPAGTPAALYLDEMTTALTTAAAIDALTDMTVSGTLSADPLFVGWPQDQHVMSSSPCDGAGTPAGAPPVDMDGAARDANTPTIGPDEI